MTDVMHSLSQFDLGEYSYLYQIGEGETVEKPQLELLLDESSISQVIDDILDPPTYDMDLFDVDSALYPIGVPELSYSPGPVLPLNGQYTHLPAPMHAIIPELEAGPLSLPQDLATPPYLPNTASAMPLVVEHVAPVGEAVEEKAPLNEQDEILKSQHTALLMLLEGVANTEYKMRWLRDPEARNERSSRRRARVKCTNRSCKRTFTHMKALCYHFDHNNNCVQQTATNFKCPEKWCNHSIVGFSSKSSMMRHVKSKHEASNENVCDGCHRDFRRADGLKRHKRNNCCPGQATNLGKPPLTPPSDLSACPSPSVQDWL